MKIRQDICIGRNLKVLRNRAGLTQEQTAARLQLNMSVTTRAVYSRYETGELNIKASDIVLLTRIFKCSYKEIFEGKD